MSTVILGSQLWRPPGVSVGKVPRRGRGRTGSARLCRRQQHGQPPPRASWPSPTSATEEQGLCPATRTAPWGRTEGRHTATGMPQPWGSRGLPQTSAGLGGGGIQQMTQLRFAMCSRLRARQMVSGRAPANCPLAGCGVPLCDSLPSRYFSVPALMFLAATVHQEPHHVLRMGGPAH